jgi:hypothetical protein
MKHLPFDKPGRFFRGNLHTHSNYSDGEVSLDYALNAYRRNGYDFVAITDHFLHEFDFPITDTRPYRDDDFTTLLGAELHAPALENGEDWHILAIGLPLDFDQPSTRETGPDLAARAAEAGAFVGIAHPTWYGMTPNDIDTVSSAHAIEIFNQGCSADSDRGESWYFADQALTQGRQLTAFGADDAHFRESHPDTFGAWTMVRAEELSPDALLNALKAGHYYSTQGPAFQDIVISDDLSEVEIKTSPINAIMLIGPKSRYVAKHGVGMTSERLPLDEFHGDYVRVTAIDSSGKRAWSNPIWLNEQ